MASSTLLPAVRIVSPITLFPPLTVNHGIALPAMRVVSPILTAGSAAPWWFMVGGGEIRESFNKRVLLTDSTINGLVAARENVTLCAKNERNPTFAARQKLLHHF